MKGDYTRSTFQPTKRYTSVRMQQGRVPLDADWNEAQDISKHLAETARTDIIGRCGFPEDAAGFALLNADEPVETLTFGPGKAYVEGLLCVNEAPVSLTNQPDLPNYPLPEADGIYLAYLDVWERHITALDDPTIKEVALGGPDTATRLKTVWQIKLEAVENADDATPPDCADFGPSWQPSNRTGTSRLRARAELDPTDERPCIIPARAGYRRLENQLYRVEIHRSGPAGTATFKWSRDNGNIVAGWSGPDSPDDTLRVTTTGKDSVLRFSPNQWVELIDDSRELYSEPGQMVRVTRAEGSLLEIDRAVNRTTFSGNPSGNPKIRGWDHAGSSEEAIPVEEGQWIVLESGVQVWFEPNGEYHTGDYWLIPARTIGATVEWPQTESGEPALAEPHGIRHHYCSLGLLRRSSSPSDGQSNSQWEMLQDCRQLFPLLTNLPLNTQACGEISVSPEDNLQSVINRIPAGGDAKLCLHPGLWSLPSTIVIANKGNIVISGAGLGTQLVGLTLDRCLLFRNCESVTVRDLQVRGGNSGGTSDSLRGALSFLDCASVTLSSVRASCNTFLSRRVSAVQIWARASSTNTGLTDVSVRDCQLIVGHQQVGLLIVNGGEIAVSNNKIETPAGSANFNISGILANAQDRDFVAAVGRQFMNRIVVGRENLDPAAIEVLDRGDFGLGDPVEVISEDVDAAGRRRLVADVSGWGGHPFAFTTDSQLSAAVWSELLRANPFVPARVQRQSGVVATRLKQLRARLGRRVFGSRVSNNNTTAIELPSSTLFSLGELRRKIEANNQVITGSQGIVIGGDRTPNFGPQEPFANGLLITGGRRAPDVTLTGNAITGFAEGIHIGTGNASKKHYRSYRVHLQNNTIHLRATSLAAQRHGIFVGHAHSLNITGNMVHVIDPAPQNWAFSQGERSQPPISPTDGIRLAGIYGPLFSVQQNHCIGVTRGIAISARHAGLHDRRFGSVAWQVTNNAYAGLGQAEVISTTPSNRL